MSATTTTKQILLTRRSPAYWRLTIKHPPLNIFGPDTIPQLNEIITALEAHQQVKVVVLLHIRPAFQHFVDRSEGVTPPGAPTPDRKLNRR
jgi:enoyl-CoA hydratase/carnithine racemase